MSNRLMAPLRRWRENYYVSRLLSSAAKPLHAVSSAIARQIETKIKRNGVTIQLGNGARMHVAKDAGVNLASGLFWHGVDFYEPESVRALLYLLERSGVFVDVGANYGFYSVLSALCNPRLRVVAFEPLLPIFQGLKKNIFLNNLEDCVTCEKLALSNHSSLGPLHPPATTGKDLESTGTLSANSWQVRQKAQPEQMETVRFDDYESAHPMKVDLIKIDGEHFEADVLLGMERVIQRDQPFIVCEIPPGNGEHKNERTRQMIEKLNYAAYWITPAGFIRVSRFDFGRSFTNFLLSPVSTEAEVLEDLALLRERRTSALSMGVAKAG